MQPYEGQISVAGLRVLARSLLGIKVDLARVCSGNEVVRKVALQASQVSPVPEMRAHVVKVPISGGLSTPLAFMSNSPSLPSTTPSQ
jgi:hypothetical protein